MGLPLAGFSQSNPASGTNATSDRCEAAAQAYESQRAACADYIQQLSDIRVRIAALQKQKQQQLEECKQAKPADQKACEEAAELMANRAGIMEQQYNTLAQTGCQQPTINPAQIKGCGLVNNKQSAADSKQTSATNSSKSGQNPSVKASNGIKQIPRTDSSAHPQPGAQQPQISNSNQGRVSGGTGSSSPGSARQAPMMNSMPSVQNSSPSSPAGSLSRPK
ncbi:MAG TPA: hypothetical protein VKH81_18495 [Candidatus Angelobacter sp.]|nr:hypothetical protein [Candidatus Angelobacter sp.]